MEWDLIHSYTTKEAVADGVLIRVPEAIAKEAGIKYPVYMTSAAWAKYVEVPDGLDEHGQSIDGRLWDILLMFVMKIRVSKSEGDTLMFNLFVLMPSSEVFESNEKVFEENKSDKVQLREVTLKSVIAPQDIDDPSPAIFIMKPNQD